MLAAWERPGCGSFPFCHLSDRSFERSFVILAMVASAETIFLATMVVISKNRRAGVPDKRAALELQMVLLAEHKSAPKGGYWCLRSAGRRSEGTSEPSSYDNLSRATIQERTLLIVRTARA